MIYNHLIVTHYWKKCKVLALFSVMKMKFMWGLLSFIMKITAVICEYNPFHIGHSIQLNAIKEKDSLVVCIMSGGFVQRGTPALFDKFARAKAAVLAGADLVLELPFPYSCSAAEFFSRSAVEIADSLGVVDELCFGSESGDIEFLKTVSQRLTFDEFVKQMKIMREDKENRQKPFAVLREEAYKELYNEQLPIRPNDILGVEYITALNKIGSTVTPVTYKRGEGYSATQSRKLIGEENNFEMLPDVAKNIFIQSKKFDIKNYERALLSYYRSADKNELYKYDGMTNGIVSHIKKSADISTNFDEFTENIKCKSHTNAKIRRCLISGVMGTTTEMLKNRPLYTQVLGCNSAGRKLIRRIQKIGNIEILTKPSHYKKLGENARKQAEFSNKADVLLTLMCEEILPADYFVKQTPYIHE